MNDSDQRAAVVAEARRWIATPYHHAADVLGAGVDCGMLIVRAYVDTGIVPAFDPRPYSPQWMLHKDEEVYLSLVLGRAVERSDAPQPGDVLVVRWGRCYSHGAIVTAWPNIVHAFAPARMVLEEDFTRNIALCDVRRVPRIFDPWGARPALERTQ